jgi:hypothetical protein
MQAQAGAGPLDRWAAYRRPRLLFARLHRARGASPQSSILHCSIETLSLVSLHVNYSFRLCFILTWCPVAQRTV